MFQPEAFQAYNFTPLAIRFLAIGCICGLLGGLILFRERFSAAGRVFGVYTLSLAFWFVGAAFGFSSPDAEVATFWGKVAHIGVTLIPAAIYHFTAVAVGVSLKDHRFVAANWIVSLFFFGFTLFIPDFLGEPRLYEWGYYPRYKFGGLLFSIYYLAVLAAILTRYYAASRRARKGTALRQRSLLLLIGFSVGGLGGLDILPTFGIEFIQPTGDVLVLFLVLITAFVTVRYRLVEFAFGLAAKRVFDAMSDALLVFDTDGVVHAANHSARKLFQEPSPSGLTLRDMAQRVGLRTDSGPAFLKESVGVHRVTVPTESGPDRVLSVSTSPMRDVRDFVVGSICLIRDVSEDHRNDELLRNARKMESLGLMAGGVAHDFNNILMGVLGNLDLALMNVDENSEERIYLDKIGKAAERAAGLADKMLIYAGRAPTAKRELDINETARSVRALIESKVPEGTKIEYRLSNEVPTVFGDVAQIQQMLVDLVLNGSEALEKRGGTVTVWTDECEVSFDFLQTADIGRSMPIGHYVRLVVADTGEGIDEFTAEKIFDPFFSTKFAGRGLGLAAVSGAVRSHDGILKCESIPGRGTSFTVLLPSLHSDARLEVH